MPRVMTSTSCSTEDAFARQPRFVEIPIHGGKYNAKKIGGSAVPVKTKPCFCYKYFVPLMALSTLLTLCLYCDYTRFRKGNAFFTDQPEIAFYALMDIPYDPYSNESTLWQSTSMINEEKYHVHQNYWLTDMSEDYSYPGAAYVFREVIKVQVNSEESSAKVLVLCVKDGRTGGFVHDFIFKQTAIIDPINRRCFIMPLDRTIISAPEEFVEMGMKMAANDYDINVKHTVRLLQLKSFTQLNKQLISPLLTNSCYKYRSFMLEEYKPNGNQSAVQPIPKGGKFAEFFGNGYVEFDVMNIEDLDALEQAQYIMF